MPNDTTTTGLDRDTAKLREILDDIVQVPAADANLDNPAQLAKESTNSKPPKP